MASVGKQNGCGKLRIRFNLDGKQRELALATADKKKAEVICNMVERLLEAKKTGEPDRLLANWLKDIPDDLRARLEKVGLLEETEKPRTIQDIIDRFKAKTGVEPATQYTYDKIAHNLLAFFKASCPLNSITAEQATSFEKWLHKKYAVATALRRVTMAKQFFNEAIRLDWLVKSPFRFCKGGDVVNKEKWRYFDVQTIKKAIDDITYIDHKAQIALMRFAGVRGASEMYQMDWTPNTIRWSTDSDRGSITILAAKTKKHEGKEFRIIPLNPILESALRALFDKAKEGQLKMFPKMKKISNPGTSLKRAFNAVGINIEQVYNLRRSYCSDVMETRFNRC